MVINLYLIKKAGLSYPAFLLPVRELAIKDLNNYFSKNKP